MMPLAVVRGPPRQEGRNIGRDCPAGLKVSSGRLRDTTRGPATPVTGLIHLPSGNVSGSH